MTNKKTNVNLKGILNSLEENEDEPQIQEKNNVVKIEQSDIKKKNRSFMLTDNTIKKLKELNFSLDKDLGTIVTEAIEQYYATHQKDINNYIKQ